MKIFRLNSEYSFDRFHNVTLQKVMFCAASIKEMLDHDAKADYGFNFSDVTFSWPKLKAARDAYVKRLNGIYETNIAKSGITLIKGMGKFKSVSEVDVPGQ